MEISPGLERAFAAVGGKSRLAALLGISPQAISQWTEVPADRVLAVVRVTGGRVSPYQLRGDFYPDPDWMPPDTEPPEEAA